MIPGSRNEPCPCGSGKRRKHCCGRADADRGEAVAAGPVPPVPIPAVEATGEPVLSIVLPYFRKLAEFTRVLPLNLPYLARAGIEVIVVADENSEEAGLLALLGGHRDVRWKVVVNDARHPWRPPCKAINVGLRHARGRYVLVASPESAFVGDVPALALQVVAGHPQGIAIGRVGFARFDDLQDGRSLERQFAARVPSPFLLTTFYGSICGPRSAFEAVRGYDETFTEGGGDDDNIRVRLEMAGYVLLACPTLRLLHLSFEPRDGGEHFDPELDFRKCTPQVALANPTADWGRDFARVALAVEAPPAAAADATDPGPSVAPAPLSAGPVVPTGSRRRCEFCGRLVHYEPPMMACACCGPAPAGIATADGKAPRIACLMQLRNEARCLEGCLAHLRDYVDGIVALDDGSTDATARILEREGELLDCLANPARDEHVWRERENQLRLLQRARALGFDWVLCCDADERYETRFLENLKAIAASFPAGELPCLSVDFRELWDDPRHYRVDGIWGRKTRARFFRLPDAIALEQGQELHGQWYPDEVRARGRMLRTRYQLYHLKSIRQEDRLRRRDLYNALDPAKRFQAEGYDYLAEEGEAVRLEAVRPGRDYDLATLPEDLRG